MLEKNNRLFLFAYLLKSDPNECNTSFVSLPYESQTDGGVYLAEPGIEKKTPKNQTLRKLANI